MFVSQVLSWKVFYLAEALEHAVTLENPMSLANNGRSLLEHIATFTTLAQRIGKLESSLYGQQSEEKIVAALGSTQNYLERAYYGTSPKGKAEGKIAALHVNDSIEDLEKQVPNIVEVYNFLCEFVHPNFGSNQLVSSGKLASGQLKPSEESNREILDKLRRVCSDCFIYLRDNMTLFMGPARVHMMLEICYQPGARLNNVFAKKQPTPSGDGKSKATAYHFPKARTAMEAIKLTYEFFERGGLTPAGPKQVGAIEEGFIYDIHSTNRGSVWVKIPMTTV